MNDLCRQHSTKCKLCEDVVYCFLNNCNMDREDDDERFCDYNQAWNSTIQHVDYDHFQQNKCNSAITTVLSLAFEFARDFPEKWVSNKQRLVYEIGHSPFKVILNDMKVFAFHKINHDRLQGLAAILYIVQHPEKKHWDSNRDNIRINFKMMLEGGVHACLYYLEKFTDCSCLKEKYPNRLFQQPIAFCCSCETWFLRDNAAVCNRCKNAYFCSLMCKYNGCFSCEPYMNVDKETVGTITPYMPFQD